MIEKKSKKPPSAGDLLRAAQSVHLEIADQLAWLLDRSAQVQAHVAAGKGGLPEFARKSLADSAFAQGAPSHAGTDASHEGEGEAPQVASERWEHKDEMAYLHRWIEILARGHQDEAKRLGEDIQRSRRGRPPGSVASKTVEARKSPGRKPAVPEVSNDRAFLVAKLMSSRGWSAQQTARIMAEWVLIQAHSELTGGARERELVRLEMNLAKKASRAKMNRK